MSLFQLFNKVFTFNCLLSHYYSFTTSNSCGSRPLLIFCISWCCVNISIPTSNINHSAIIYFQKCRICESRIVRLWFGKPLTKQRLDGVVNSWFSSRLITHNSWFHSVTHSAAVMQRLVESGPPPATYAYAHHLSVFYLSKILLF